MIISKRSRVLTGPAENWICASCQRQQLQLRRSFSSLQKRQNQLPSEKFYDYPHLRPDQEDYRDLEAGPSARSPRRNEKVPDFPARTRFAPSPTGYMHIGGLRTALFSYLLARKTKGQFLLRIEDTDQKRLVPDAEERLCEDLQKAGLQWDEGPQVGGPYGPYKQSERTKIYQEHAKHLLDPGSAYRCFCTPRTVNARGRRAAYVTSGCYQDCSSLSTEEAQDRAEDKKEAYTVRLKLPADAHKRVYKDLIYGNIQRLKRSPSSSPGGEDDSAVDAADTVLIKSDGTPTYHFANVVDDHLMKISHVIRGTEWSASTPLHYDLYHAFGWESPAFAHVGLLVDEKKQKLSKRSNTGLVLDVRSMREKEGILPEALNNFLALLGWSNPNQNDVMEMKGLIRDFDLKFTKGNTVVKMDKLWYLQKQHIARKCGTARASNSNETIQGIVAQIRKEAELQFPDAIKKNFPDESKLDEYCAQILLADSKAYRTPKEYVERNRYFFYYDPSEIQHSENFSDGAATMAYAAIVKKLLTTFYFKQPYQEPVVPGIAPSEPDTEIDRTSHLIHAAIQQCIWRALANPMWLMLPEDKYAEAAAAGKIPPAGQELEYVPFTEKNLDKRAFAKFLGDNGVNPQLRIAGVEETVQAYNEWNKGVMKYLRERLSYGLPGPGVGQVMAILGYEECCRRVGVTAKEGGGW